MPGDVGRCRVSKGTWLRCLSREEASWLPGARVIEHRGRALLYGSAFLAFGWGPAQCLCWHQKG